MRYLRLVLVLALCAGLTAAACRQRTQPAPQVEPPPLPVAEAPPPPQPPPPAEAPPAAPTVALSEDEIFARKTLDELNAERPLGHVFFDYDQSAIRDDARTTLQVNAEWLRRWTSTRITVEGHADSRGTNEYNLGLGDRRANAVRDYLVSLGIAGDRILAVTRGEESPACFEENESCWQQNRRGHFLITAK